MSHQTGLSVVVPAYRSAETLPDVVEQLRLHVAPLFDEIEIILVDDGSGDDTWRTIEQISHNWSAVRGIRLLRNYGQHNALLAGLRDATQPLVLTLDDDLQNPPSEVPRMIERLDDTVDLVYGRPREERQGFLRNLASRSSKRLMSGALGPDVYPGSSSFRLFRRELVQAGAHVHDPGISIDVLLSWGTGRIVDVEVEFAERSDGQSGYTFRKLVRHALNMITGYSTQPLRMVSATGLIVAAFGFCALVFVLGRYAVGNTDVAGFTFLAAAITLFSGVQLLSLGILGEYLGRVHVRSMGKPTYLVADTTTSATQDEPSDLPSGAEPGE